MSATDFANSHHEKFLEELKEFLRIPSISTLPENQPDIKRAAEWLATHLRSIGIRQVEVRATRGNPVVYGSLHVKDDAPTLLIYGHYDVQPVDPLELWTSQPFAPEVRDDKLYARGSTDDKGQVFAQLKAVQSYLHAHNGKPPINIKFLIEGEEEIGSENLDAWIDENKSLLEADVCVISDSQILALNRPSITYSVRGLLYMELHVRGPKSDLHSGSYGGTVHNPLQALCEIITALHNADGSVAIPGFYNGVHTISPAEHEALGKISWTEEEWRAETGAPKSWGEAAFTLRERIGARPTLEVNGLLGGFTGAGSKTVLPAQAMAKISCRLVDDQDPAEIEKLLRARVAELTPPTVVSELIYLNSGKPASVPMDDPAMEAASRAYQRGFGSAPVLLREGGTLPIVATLRSTFGMPVVLLGFGLHDDGAHAPNEKFDLKCFYRGIDTAIAMLEELEKFPTHKK